MQWQRRTRAERAAIIAAAVILVLMGMGLIADRGGFPPRGSGAFELDRDEKAEVPPGPALAVSDDSRVWLPSRVGGAGNPTAAWPEVPSFTTELIAFPAADRIVSLGRLGEPEPAFCISSIEGADPRRWRAARRFALGPRFTVDLPPSGQAGEVEVRELPSGEVRWSATMRPVACAVLSANGRKLLTGYSGGGGAVWTLDPRAVPLILPTDFDKTVGVLSGDGRHLALVPELTENGAWHGEIWNLEERRVTTLVEGTAETLLAAFPDRPPALTSGGIRFEGDGRLLAHADPLGPRVTLFDVGSGTSEEARGYLLDAVGRRLAIYDPIEGTIRVAGPGPSLSAPIAIGGKLTASHACRGGRWLALSVTETREATLVRSLLGIGEPRHAVLVLDLLEAEIVLSTRVRLRHVVGFSPNGRTFAVLDGPGQLKVWKME